jgi:hypothetical protein
MPILPESYGQKAQSQSLLPTQRKGYSMKLAILGLLQITTLSLGVTLIASVSPRLELDYWPSVMIGACGTVLVVGALTARDYIGKLAGKR